MVESCGRSAWWRRDKGSFGNARQGKSLVTPVHTGHVFSYDGLTAVSRIQDEGDDRTAKVK